METTRHILITGGCGFIGSNLINRLMSDPLNIIICIDNLSTGDTKNISKWLDNSRFSFMEQDITIPLENKYEKIDQIYHLACPASPLKYQKDGIHTIKTSVIGTLNILELAEKYGSEVLFSSTSEVYGDPQVSPQTEEYWGNVNPVGIRSCYDVGKRCAESICCEYIRQKRIKIHIARIFNTYGPGMAKNDGRVISNFISQALSGNAITVYGDGSQTRSFCYIDDTIDGLIKLMNSEESIPINIGNPEEYTILELAQKIRKCVNADIKITYTNLPEDDPKRRLPDITKAKVLLGWEPSINIEKGLDKTIEYFSNL